jgi:hypothetical protein
VTTQFLTRLPRCKDCGGGQPRVVGIESRDLRVNAMRVYHVWLCASCEYKRAHPLAAPAVLMPNERRPLRLQEETLF